MKVFEVNFYKVVILLCLWVIPGGLSAQQYTLPTDAVSASQASAIVGSSDIWTSNSNPAALGKSTGYGINAAASNRFLIEGLFDYGLYIHTTIGEGGMGLRIDHFAFEGFRQQQFALSYGRLLSDRLLIGGEITYLGINQPIEGTTAGLLGNLGLIYEVNTQLSLGLTVQPLQIRWSEDVRYPSLQRLGFSYRPNDQVAFRTEINYLSGTRNYWSVRTGISYDIFENVQIGLGYRSNPNLFTFGIAFTLSDSFHIQIASEVHQQLGLSPLAGFSYHSN